MKPPTSVGKRAAGIQPKYFLIIFTFRSMKCYKIIACRGSSPTYVIFSKQTCLCYYRAQIQPIAMSLDNYGYLVTDQRTGTAVLIDPADVERVQVSRVYAQTRTHKLIVNVS